MEAKNKLPDGVEWPENKEWKWFAIDALGMGLFYRSMPKRASYANFFLKNYGSDGLPDWMEVGRFKFSKGEKWTNSIVQRPENINQ